ncbi:hypothetical protein LMH87_010396 [Akanthomyces muscarius]|uniref:Uncharacterized protein n=1 Tax=Akanthomyces muscarius TaxID=2231603 RepID=A0A9W8QE46_AKAMU|nr:hypothetical protein LMH87_010396 [Akanthomyces muscarius]KAJ4153930.1 hypothetical protein LMH87_010396 [Akanthomyces muscarius]
MAGVHRSADDLSRQEHGLHFTNDAWNDTILNGNEFTLRWNDTIDAKDGILGLFRVTYPREGVVVYEAAQNITNCLQPTYCKWKAESLGDDLYSFWLASGRGSNASFAISPPWTAKQPKVHSFTWAAPFLVPICLLLFLYFVCVTTCLLYKRRKKAKRRIEEAARTARRRAISASENEAEEFHMMSIRHVNRHGSVDSTMTLEGLEPPEDVLRKQDVWLFSTTTSSTAGSEDTVVSESSQTAERRAAHTRALTESTKR